MFGICIGFIITAQNVVVPGDFYSQPSPCRRLYHYEHPLDPAKITSDACFDT